MNYCGRNMLVLLGIFAIIIICFFRGLNLLQNLIARFSKFSSAASVNLIACHFLWRHICSAQMLKLEAIWGNFALLVVPCELNF